MKSLTRILTSTLAVGLLSAALAAQTSSAGRYDAAIQPQVVTRLTSDKHLQNVRSSVEDGIVTLTGAVDIYQQKLDAAKKVRKLTHVQGVRNLITVAGNTVPDADLTATLDRKLYYDRLGLDNLFNFVTASVNDGVVTLIGETRNPNDLDSALSLVDATPGVKDVINNVSVAPASNFDDRIRLEEARVIYRDPVLSRYAIDPARPIRIVVENGKVSLYGVVSTTMDKQVAGIRAGQVFGAFSVQNNLEVVKRS
jgi:hyperosmotically inducible periplasmic protein